MIFADICKPIYEACPAIKSQDKYIDGLLGAAGGVSISKSYKKQLFKGEDNGKKKNLTLDLRRNLRGKNKQDSVKNFFYDNIADDCVQKLIGYYGIVEKDEPDKNALCYALNMQLQALIDTDEDEAADIINAMYQQAKAGHSVPADKIKEYGSKYIGDQIWVEEMGKLHEEATLTGGLLLLNTSITEDAETVNLARNIEQTGCAVYNQQNSSDQTKRGNYNATETEIDVVNKKIKYVYDFDTAEGNGTIACVALTHAFGGYTNRGTATDPVKGLYPFFLSLSGCYLRLTGSNSGINGCDRTYGYTSYGTGYKWIIKVDATTDMVYYFTLTSTTSLKIRRYRANINTVSLFDTPTNNRTFIDETDVTYSTAVNQQYFSYNYDEESDKLYIISASNYYVANNGAYVITEIDMANDYAVTQYAMTNKTGTSIRLCYEKCNAMCYEGYIYFQNYSTSTHNIYRQQIGTPANVQQLSTESAIRQAYPMWAKNGKVYFEMPSSYSGTYCLYIIDTDSFTMTYPETYTLMDSSYHQYVPIIGYPLAYYCSFGSSNGIFALRTDYLATINNLESPVVKTADKTMKVTYTLQEQ